MASSVYVLALVCTREGAYNPLAEENDVEEIRT